MRGQIYNFLKLLQIEGILVIESSLELSRNLSVVFFEHKLISIWVYFFISNKFYKKMRKRPCVHRNKQNCPQEEIQINPKPTWNIHATAREPCLSLAEKIRLHRRS
jgi:hypothetical protein